MEDPFPATGPDPRLIRLAAQEPGLLLIETMLWDGHHAPRWPLHRARLHASAFRLGWTCPEGITPRGPSGAARLRLTLDAEGRVTWQEAPLPPTPTEWRVMLSSLRLASSDPWLGIKSSHRPLHDAARAALPEGMGEVILLNERGEICEGTITNVFFDRGHGLRTPPRASGLLPGVLRAELACPEEVLRPEDLPHVRLWLGNALRGLIPARLAS